MLTPQEHAERVALVNQGLSDKQIGEIVHLSPAGVAHWRLKAGIKSRYTEFQDRQRMEAYRAGLTTKQIAAQCGITVKCVKGWLQRRGLHANKKRVHGA